MVIFLQVVFNAIDTNSDGKISWEEWCYAFMSFVFVSGPDSPVSLFYGPLVEDSHTAVPVVLFCKNVLTLLNRNVQTCEDF